jgi:hypothetical protein
MVSNWYLAALASLADAAVDNPAETRTWYFKDDDLLLPEEEDKEDRDDDLFVASQWALLTLAADKEEENEDTDDDLVMAFQLTLLPFGGPEEEEGVDFVIRAACPVKEEVMGPLDGDVGPVFVAAAAVSQLAFICGCSGEELDDDEGPRPKLSSLEETGADWGVAVVDLSH